MLQAKATLYLVPAPLDFGCDMPADAAADIRTVLPQSTIAAAASLRYWVVENGKSARAVLKRIAQVAPLSCTLQELSIAELPRAMHKKGDHSAAQTDSAAIAALLAPLSRGCDMGLLSEAGMPAVADPGSSLVRAAHAMGARVLPLVGPSSLLLALAASGLNGQNFAFVGYVPQQPGPREARLRELQALARKTGQAQLLIETPYRNAALCEAMLAVLAPDMQLAISAGLTLEHSYTALHTVAQWRKTPPPAQVLALPCLFTIGL